MQIAHRAARAGAVFQAITGPAVPGEKRTVTLLADPDRVEPGTHVEIESDPGLTVTLRIDAPPNPASEGLVQCRQASGRE